jgi:hypothetical protein
LNPDEVRDEGIQLESLSYTIVPEISGYANTEENSYAPPPESSSYTYDNNNNNNQVTSNAQKPYLYGENTGYSTFLSFSVFLTFSASHYREISIYL